mgnify:CR=1 FL=1
MKRRMFLGGMAAAAGHLQLNTCRPLLALNLLHAIRLLADGAERLALLDVDLAGSNQVVVDIHSRFLFEAEVFRRRERGTGL